MVAELKALLTNKLALTTVTLVIVWCFFDGLERFNDKALKHNNSKSILTTSALLTPQLSVKTVNEITETYQQYMNKETDKITQKRGMSTEEQAAQKGQLKSFFIGDNKLQLKAVIQNEQQQLIALIQVENIISGIKTIKKFSQDTLVYGYTLTIEKNTQVKLTNQQKQKDQSGKKSPNKSIAQQIILTMYTAKV